MVHGSRRRTWRRIEDGGNLSYPVSRARARRQVKRDPTDPKPLIRDRALALGFDAVGFCRAELGAEARTRLAEFLAAGQHGDMGWLARRTEQRSHPQSLWPAARSVVALGLSYAPQDDPLATLALADRGSISVYARNRDYHDVLKGRLKHLAQFIVARFGPEVRVFVDTAPVMEKPLAERAGIGWQGKHTNLVSRTHGSWLFLGEIYTTSTCCPTRRMPTAAAAARAASTFARPLRSPRPTGSTRRAASPTSPSSITGRSARAASIDGQSHLRM